MAVVIGTEGKSVFILGSSDNRFVDLNIRRVCVCVAINEQRGIEAGETIEGLRQRKNVRGCG